MIPLHSNDTIAAAARLILVTGSTGQQGRSLVSALRPSTEDAGTSHSFRILALTRNKNSPSARRLALERHVDVVEGDLDDAKSIRRVFEDAKKDGGVWGVFCVLAFPGLGANADGEERQGKTVADLALEFGVSSFIYSSAEHNVKKEDEDDSSHRGAKVRIERHVRKLGEKGLPWTIMRPGFFMENFEGTLGSITFGVLNAGLKPDTTLQLIAADDIGRVAAGVFKAPETYVSQAMVVFGDILTVQGIAEAYKSATGHPIPSIPRFLARLLIYANRNVQGLLAEFEDIHIYQGDPSNQDHAAEIAAAKKANPNRTSLGAWALQRKGKDSERKNGWNQLSIFRLVTGRL